MPSRFGVRTPRQQNETSPSGDEVPEYVVLPVGAVGLAAAGESSCERTTGSGEAGVLDGGLGGPRAELGADGGGQVWVDEWVGDVVDRDRCQSRQARKLLELARFTPRDGARPRRAVRAA